MIHEEKTGLRISLNVTHLNRMTSSGSWQYEAARKLGVSLVVKVMQHKGAFCVPTRVSNGISIAVVLHRG